MKHCIVDAEKEERGEVRDYWLYVHKTQHILFVVNLILECVEIRILCVVGPVIEPALVVVKPISRKLVQGILVVRVSPVCKFRAPKPNTGNESLSEATVVGRECLVPSRIWVAIIESVPELRNIRDSGC